MNDKTLVERLRDGKKRSICLSGNLENILNVKFQCHGMECDECYTRAFNALADAIEREYLPRPRLLDAEKVPINIGDTVWNINTGECRTVDEVGDFWFGASDYAVKLNPLMYSHKQPDSLERIEEDAKKSVCEYFAKQDKNVCDSCNGLHYLECRRDMNLELLRRQRKILERS